MTAVAMESKEARSERVATRVRLSRDDTGWTLSGPKIDRQFPDLETALDCARRSPDMKAATIEIWQGGQYICCVPLDASRHRRASIPGADRYRARLHPVLAIAERYANRAAQVVFAAAGPLFWLVLILAALAASLGWRLLLL
jgi:hypothetical protein